MKKYYLAFLVSVLLLPQIIFAKLPNDPQAQQWAYEHVKVYDAWNYVIGSKDVVVAVIDNGFDTFHPDLRNNLWKNEDEISGNGIDDDDNGYIDDVWGWNFVPTDLNKNGKIDVIEAKGNNDPRPRIDELSDDDKKDGTFHHGTVVAGLIGAVGDNKKDGTGISWRVRLMNIKVVESSGWGSLAYLAPAIRYAVDNGADVINVSMVGDGDQNEEIKQAVKYAFDKGVAVIAAAGNNSIHLDLSPLYPICSDASENDEWVLGVSAIDPTHHLTRFSNIGASCIDITAPGTDVSSTVRYAPLDGLANEYEGGWAGTSFGTPLVSGAAALLKSIHPEWKAKEIYQALLATVHHTPGQDETVYAQLFGSGLLQIDKTVKYALERLTANVLSKILSIEPFQGRMNTHKPFSSADKIADYTALQGIDDFAVYKDGDKTMFAAVKMIGKNRSEVSLHNESLQEVKKWEIKAKGRLTLIAGDVLGDENLEIILAPVYGDKWAFRIFDLQGNELQSFSISAALHKDVALGLSGKKGENKKELLALFENNGKLEIHHFDRELKLKKVIDISSDFKKRAVIASGDVDGDGENEYVAGGGVGEAPYIAYYSQSGEQKRKFTAYDISYNKGLGLLVGDYNKDGKAEMIVSALGGGQPVRVWNYRSKIVDEWWPFGEENKSGVRLASY